MPNHVMNIVKMKGITALPVFAGKEDGDTAFDFGKIIPMPESLNVSCGTVEAVAVETAIRKAAAAVKQPIGPQLIPGMTDSEYAQRLAQCGEDEDTLCKLGVRYFQNLVLYGATGWYDWCNEHWGTKWSSYENHQIDKDTIAFMTAWSAPEPVIAQLAKMYPEAEIEHWWADEDIGNNDGYAKYNGGRAVELIEYESCSHEAYAAYVLCWGESACLYQDEIGIWHRRNCDECHGCD